MKQIEVVAAIIHDDEDLTMHCFWCHVESGSLTLKEHEAARWLTKDSLYCVKWLPSDVKVLEEVRRKMGEG